MWIDECLTPDIFDIFLLLIMSFNMFSQILARGWFAEWERSMSCCPPSLGTHTICIHLNSLSSSALSLTARLTSEPPWRPPSPPKAITQPRITDKLNLSITGIWHNEGKTKKENENNKTLSASRGANLVFCPRVVRMERFFQNTISLWKIENIEKQ